MINIPDFGNDDRAFEEFWSSVPDLIELEIE